MAVNQLPQKTSPMMVQWHACKQSAGSALLLFRLGDFYEAFYEDAVTLSKELELTLTKRQEIPMAGIPCHAYENYLDRLIAKGYRVAIAEQTEDPKTAKGLVRREVVQVVTPGTVINSSLLSDKSNNFFASLAQVGERLGLAFADVTTGEFYVSEFENIEALSNELFRLRPAEFLIPTRFLEKHKSFFKDLELTYSFLINSHDDWHFDHQIAHNFLTSHFGTLNLDGFGLKGLVAGINAGGALLQYLQDHLYRSLEQIQEVRAYTTTQYMALDPTTQRNLELTESMRDGSRRQTLLDILDATATPMGGRLIRHWVKQPLLDPDAINQRLDAVEFFVRNNRSLTRFELLLQDIRDLERLIVKISSGYASPKDLAALRSSLEPVPYIKEALQEHEGVPALVKEKSDLLKALPEVTGLIARAINDDPPLRLSDGNIFREGYCQELDELRAISRDGKSWIARYQASLRETLGIKSLKVGYNRMFGYYIEVSKGQVDQMPDTFQRRQTLVNGERYISEELKDYESKVLSAEERIAGIENALFSAIKEEISQHKNSVIQIARAIAVIDTLNSLAKASHSRGYCRPIIDQSETLSISEGRHPVIEALGNGDKFVPNDVLFDGKDSRLLLITGPNMAGKSTFIRQVALITIMAQIGSFVPARAAHIGIIDRVFTRIGASDDLARGQSTFMVEMTETANILNNATDRSLVILDEIGRGTSTYDGISIAWSVAEHLLTADGCRAKTLFATHYWELTKLEEKIPGAVNFNVAVHETEDSIIFLRKIIKGSTDKSYGIHVARLAGVPSHVILRAKEILSHLEENANRKGVFEPSAPSAPPPRRRKTRVDSDLQLSFFGK